MADLPLLDPTEQRVLGALMEKQVTVPATYPLTLNALRSACNQRNSREPVTDLDDATIETTAKALKDRGLLRIVWADRGPRTLKYHQLLTEELDVDVAEAAVLTVMLLRGPQAPGELKTRTERQHHFEDRHQVEELLATMAVRGLVRELPRQPGQRDQRWEHLLTDHPAPADDVPETGVDPLRDGAEAREERVRRSYAEIAHTFADKRRQGLRDEPFERWLLDRAAQAAGDAPVADVGSGGGAVAAYLHEQGARVRGFDLSPEMVAEATALVPGVEFQVGDLRRLLKPVDADGWGAIVAWYALVHLAGTELSEAVAALARTLRSGGLLAASLHAGGGGHRMQEFWGHEVDLDFVHHEPGPVAAALESAGLVAVEWYLRGGAGVQGPQRLYVVGRKP